MPHVSRIISLASVLLALGSATPNSLRAQSLDSLLAGTRVRVAGYEPRPVIGALLRVDSAGVLVSPDGGGQPVLVHRYELHRVDVSGGSRSRSEAFWEGAEIGFMAGATIGLLATGLALREDLSGSSNDSMIYASVAVGTLSVMFTGVTTLLGGVVGSTKAERWKRVWPPAESRRR